jgi:tRNA threonylcarbamoyl adenosine modification protein (Sua5/YciO/YrdC/YwlC family)
MSLFFDCTKPDQRAEAITAAVDATRRGELVVLPTDTVYGLGADAFIPAAVHSLLRAKGRGRDMPVPVLVGSWAALDGLVLFLPHRARDLVEAFWPGGLTLVVEYAPSLIWDLGDTRGTVAVRMPLHPVAIELLKETGPMAVSSANRTGQPPATTAQQAQDQLGDDVYVYLDGGPSGDPLPSTIVDLTGERPRLLRAGAVSAEDILELIPETIVELPAAAPAKAPEEAPDKALDKAADPAAEPPRA